MTPNPTTRGGRRVGPTGHSTPAPPAASNPLAELLDEIAADPDAGAWGDWAARLLAGDSAEDGGCPAVRPGNGDWRPRQPR